jgi:hypothetical protein
MFVLRQPHLDAFAQVARESFEDRVLPHLRERFAEECEELGDQKVRARIQDGIDRAARYEIRQDADVTAFIRLMFGLRPDFDTARQTAWAGEILRDLSRPAPERLADIKKRARAERAAARKS